VEHDVIEVEGLSLEEALKAATERLGVPREAIDFTFDRDHLAGGANTVRIFAKKKSAEAIAAAAEARERESRAPRDRADRGPGDHRGDHRGGRDRGPPRDRGRDRRRDAPHRDQRDRPRGRPESEQERQERDEKLKETARGLVRRALEGEAVSIPDLNSYERHLVHTIVAEAPGLASRSVGEGLRKTVHIERKPEPS
jgi:predicted RNA-binding protein Jag